MLTVIDLDAILNIKEIKKSKMFYKLHKTSTIMFAGCSITKNTIDNLHISYDYFYRKDKNFVVKKREVINDASSLIDAIEIVKLPDISNEEVFVFGQNLELEEEYAYQVFDLEDQFTDFYDSKNDIDAFVKKVIYHK